MFYRVMCVCLVYCSCVFAGIDQKCVDDCDSKCQSALTHCSVEYLNALMKCDPEATDFDACFEDATKNYDDCVAKAYGEAVGCFQDCSDGIVPPIPHSQEECILECEAAHSASDAACLDEWLENYYMCDQVIDPRAWEKCKYWALQDYRECKNKSLDEYEECMRGCENVPSS